MAIRQKLQELSPPFLLGCILPAILSLGIFATRADLAELKTEMYREFLQRKEFEMRWEKLEKTMDEIRDKLYEREGKR